MAKRFILFLFLAFVPVSIFAADAEEPLSLKDLLIQAHERNPEIQAARQAWKVKEAQIGAVGSWPDPTFTFVDERFPSNATGVSPQTVRHYRLEQKIPFPGKLTSEAEMKYHEALIASAGYRTRLLDVDRDVRMRFYQLYLTDQKIDIARQTVEVLTNALKSAESRLASGQSSASDVFMAQTELRRMENALFEQRQERILVGVELNTLLDQDTDTPLGKAAAPPLIDLPGDLNDFQIAAQDNAPLYLSATHEINHSKVALHRSRLAWTPDLGVMAERETTPGGEAGRQFGASLSFPLWFRRPWNDSVSAREHMEEAVASGRQMKNEVLKNVHLEFIQTRTHLAMARRYESAVLPAALSNLRVARQQYASGHGDFLRLLEALRTWLTAHNDYQEELYRYGQHWSELGRWTGVDVEHLKEALAQREWMPATTHDK